MHDPTAALPSRSAPRDIRPPVRMARPVGEACLRAARRRERRRRPMPAQSRCGGALCAAAPADHWWRTWPPFS